MQHYTVLRECTGGCLKERSELCLESQWWYSPMGRGWAKALEVEDTACSKAQRREKALSGFVSSGFRAFT